MEKEKIIIYQTSDGQTSIDVILDQGTVWLTQVQMAELFESTRQNISLHINNIYKEGELSKDSTIKESLIVRKEGKRTVNRTVEQYSLDVLISAGYRVKSLRGTQFRIWANNVLKEYLTKGYALNEKRLQEQTQQFDALKQTVRILGNVLESKPLTSDEASGLLKILTDYTYALDVLDKYDHRTLAIEATHKKTSFVVTYDEAFSDGNKRIAAFLFIWFLEKNGLLYREDGTKRIADNAIVALTLMIAESKPDEKDIMTQVVVNLINGYN